MYRTAWRRSPDGAPRWRYRCNAQFDRARSGDRACGLGAGSVFAERVEEAFRAGLLAALGTILPPDAVQARIEDAQLQTAAQRAARRGRLERRLADLERQRERLLDLALAGRVDDARYAARDAALVAEIDGARAELAAVPAPVDPAALERRHAALVDIAGAVLIAIRHAPAELPALLHALDARLIVGPDGMRVALGGDAAPFFERGS